MSLRPWSAGIPRRSEDGAAGVQFTTAILRNLFEIPRDPAAFSEPESEDEPE